DSPFMKILLISVVLVIAAVAVTGSGAVFQNTVDIGSGELAVSTASQTETSGDESNSGTYSDNTSRTLAACVALAEKFNACTTDRERRAVLSMSGGGSTFANQLRRCIYNSFDYKFLRLEDKIVSTATTYYNYNLYIHPYFVMRGNQVDYILLYAEPYRTIDYNTVNVYTCAVYFPATQTWYDYIKDGRHGFYYNSYPIDYFSYYSETTTGKILTNYYSFFDEWAPFGISHITNEDD
ncbi:MAG TPA: hypothetical protein PLT66_05825, partial [Bacillota bacterium]|nr:hypothetical protein [Bacillota bacterium]